MPTPQDYPTTSERARRLDVLAPEHLHKEFVAARARLLHAYVHSGKWTWEEIAKQLSCTMPEVVAIFRETTYRSLG